MKPKSLNDIYETECRLLALNRGKETNRADKIIEAACNARAERGLSRFSQDRNERKQYYWQVLLKREVE